MQKICPFFQYLYYLHLNGSKRLAILGLAGAILLQTDSLDSNEAARVLLT